MKKTFGNRKNFKTPEKKVVEEVQGLHHNFLIYDDGSCERID